MWMNRESSMLCGRSEADTKCHILYDFAYMKHPGQINPQRQKIGDCQGLREGNRGEELLNAYGVFFSGNENDDDLDRGCSCITL